MKEKVEKPSYYRQPGESARPFEAFQLYRDRGPSRSLDAVSRQVCKSKSLLGRWSRQWQWATRVAEFDDYMAEEQRRRYDEFAFAEVQRWAKLDQEKRNEKLQMSDALISKCYKMLDFPLGTVRRETTPSGENVTIVPAKWTMGDVAPLAETAFELARQAIRNEGSLCPPDQERKENWKVEDYKEKD